jgi:hypothetical protein
MGLCGRTKEHTLQRLRQCRRLTLIHGLAHHDLLGGPPLGEEEVQRVPGALHSGVKFNLERVY